jgi:hypothetical protein
LKSGAIVNYQIHMTVEWKVGTDHVAVTYRVTNGGAAPVYVIDGRFRAGPSGSVIWSDRLSVSFGPPATALLGSFLTPLNPSIHSMFPPSTFAVRLAAEVTHESTLTALLPLLPDGMTTQPAPTAVFIGGKRIPPLFTGAPPQLADRSIVCRTATFELGVIPHDESLLPQPARLADRDVFRLEQAAWSLQRIERVGRRPIELPMQVPAEVVGRT